MRKARNVRLCHERTNKADLIFYTELYVDAGYDYEEAERMAKDLLRVIGVIFDEDKVI